MQHINLRANETDNVTAAEMRANIFNMVWPATVENVLQMMVGIVSSAMIGRIGSLAVGAVGLGRRINLLVWAVFAAIGTGATVMIARSIGAKDRKSADSYAIQAFAFTLIFVLCVSLVIYAFPRQLIAGLYHATGDLLAAGTLYLKITAWGIPFMAVMQVTGAIMRGAGNTKVPMQIALAINIVNVILSYYLIFGGLGLPAMGLVGAGIAANIAQAVGAFLAIDIMFHRQTDINLQLQDFRFVWSPIRNMLQIGIPTAVENILMQLGQIMLTGLVVSFGTIALAAHQQGITAESLSYMPAVGFGIAATTFVGQSMGAGSARLAERYVRELGKWSMIMTLFTASFLIFTPRQLFSLLSNDPAVIQLGAWYLIMMGFAQFPQQLSGVLNGALRGAGDTRAPMVIGGVGLWGIRLPLAYFLSKNLGMGIIGVWAAMTFDLFVRFTLSLMRYRRGRWKNQYLDKKTPTC